MAHSHKDQIKSKIDFLEEQLSSLNQYLPETYGFLMAELDLQKRELAEIEVLETFSAIDCAINPSLDAE